MYNRYIPQQDGTHQRRRVEEPNRGADAPGRLPPQDREYPAPRPTPHPNGPPTESIGGFLKQLLPKDFDTGDLIVVLLLLLMAGDKPEERNTALLTLALYCFL